MKAFTCEILNVHLCTIVRFCIVCAIVSMRTVSFMCNTAAPLYYLAVELPLNSGALLRDCFVHFLLKENGPNVVLFSWLYFALEKHENLFMVIFF